MAIAEVIKYEGDNSTFIWKHPSEDFNCFTQLIVHESQEAIFFMNGQALDSFGPGRYTFDSQNIPILGKLIDATVHGGESPFHCEVYFINKTVQMSIKWGTDSKVRYIDQDSGIPIELGASGEMNLAVDNGRKLLVKLVGTTSGISWDNENNNLTQSLRSSFRPLISTQVKSNLSQAIKQENFDILEIDEHLEKLSSVLKDKINPGFEEYGLTIPQFFITSIVLPEEDPNFRRLKELHTISLQTRMIKAQSTIKQAQALADADVETANRQLELEKQLTQTEITRKQAERDIIEAQADAEKTKLTGFAEAQVMAAKGYNQKDVLQAEVQKAYAEGLGNMGSSGGSAGGSVVSDIVGLGVGLKAAGAFTNQLGDMFNTNTNNQTSNASSITCSKCGATIPANSKFCLECGAPITLDNEITCPNCGKKVIKGKFCPECGQKL